jgi:Tfp pilus assembly protein PilO
MKDFIKKHKIVLIVTAYFVAVGLVSLFFAWPMMKEVREKNNELQTKMVDQEIKKDRLAKLSSIREQFEMVKNQEGAVNISLNKENVVSLVEKLEKISDDTGNKIKIELFDEQSEKKKSAQAKKANNDEKIIIENLPSDKYIMINISLKGGYGSFMNFLKKLENMEYYADVVSVKVSKNSDSQNVSASNPFETNPISENAPSEDGKNDVLSTISAVFYLENN